MRFAVRLRAFRNTQMTYAFCVQAIHFVHGRASELSIVSAKQWAYIFSRKQQKQNKEPRQLGLE
jgi:hypothetical protein